jgi:NAD(P)-dependent dehydrogenase (short-subunit alcohol dehydrogenase family)
MNRYHLDNKTILVTGCTSGIGHQIALQCIEQNARVIGVGRNKDRLNDLKIKGEGRVEVFETDLSQEDDLDKLVSLAGVVDGIVHSAGIMKTLPFKFISKNELEAVFAINFYAPVLLTQKMLKAKKINKNSSIVFISSIGGNVIGSKGNAMYSASKAAINGIAKVMSLELASSGIRVNTVNPGMVKTEMWSGSSSSIDEEMLAIDEKKYPLGYGETRDVSGLTLFLLSEESKWITGSNMIIDGGFSIQ